MIVPIISAIIAMTPVRIPVIITVVVRLIPDYRITTPTPRIIVTIIPVIVRVTIKTYPIWIVTMSKAERNRNAAIVGIIVPERVPWIIVYKTITVNIRTC